MTLGIRWSREIIPIRKRGAIWIIDRKSVV